MVLLLLSSTKGNYEGSVKSDNGQDDAGITQDFDQQGLTDGSYGLLPNHRDYRISVFGGYQATDNLVLGFNTSLTAPRKFGCRVLTQQMYLLKLMGMHHGSVVGLSHLEDQYTKVIPSSN